MSSDGDENDASEKTNTQHHHDASEADTLSLFGGVDIDEIDDTVSRIWRMETLTTLVFVCNQLFLSCSQDTGPPITSGLAELVNGKFYAEYSAEKRKGILQK